LVDHEDPACQICGSTVISFESHRPDTQTHTQTIYCFTRTTFMKQPSHLSWNMHAQTGTPVLHLNSQMHLKQFSGGLLKSLLEAAHTVKTDMLLTVTSSVYGVSSRPDKSSAVAEMGDCLATTDMGRNVGSCCAPFRGGAESPCSTMSPRPRPTFVLSCILIHVTV